MKIEIVKVPSQRLIIPTIVAQFIGEAIDHHVAERNPVHGQMGQINFLHKLGYMDPAMHDRSYSRHSNGWTQDILSCEGLQTCTLATYPVNIGPRMDILRHITSSRILPKGEEILKLSLYVIPLNKPLNVG